jgi:hypothetical protein
MLLVVIERGIPLDHDKRCTEPTASVEFLALRVRKWISTTHEDNSRSAGFEAKRFGCALQRWVTNPTINAEDRSLKNHSQRHRQNDGASP